MLSFFQVVIWRSRTFQGPWLSSNIFGMLSVEMPFALTAHSFGPPQQWNISFLQRFDISEQPEVILDAGLEDEEDNHAT